MRSPFTARTTRSAIFCWPKRPRVGLSTTATAHWNRPFTPNKDCSEAQLRRRLQTIIEEGGDQVWCAVPEEVVSYHLCRRHAVVETVAATPREQRYRIRYEALPARVEHRELTFEVEVPAAWCNFPRVWVNGGTPGGLCSAPLACCGRQWRPRTGRSCCFVLQLFD